MSYKLPKLLSRKTKKSKEEKEREEQDALQRSNFAPQSSGIKPKVDEHMFDPNNSVIDDYYNAKQNNRTIHSYQEQSKYLGQGEILNNYESVHAEKFKQAIENRDEDDLSEENDNFNTFLEDRQHFLDDEDGEHMPLRNERTRGFNEDFDIGEFRMKGEFGFDNFKEKKEDDLAENIKKALEKTETESEMRGTEVIGQKNVHNILRESKIVSEMEDDDINE